MIINHNTLGKVCLICYLHVTDLTWCGWRTRNNKWNKFFRYRWSCSRSFSWTLTETITAFLKLKKKRVSKDKRWHKNNIPMWKEFPKDFKCYLTSVHQWRKLTISVAVPSPRTPNCIHNYQNLKRSPLPFIHVSMFPCGLWLCGEFAGNLTWT